MVTGRTPSVITKKQKSRHVDFAKHLVNRWNIPKTTTPKILFINYDEKWFYRLVARTMAKMCLQLGLFRNTKSVYHKNFITKVMLVAITGYAFVGDIEDGGEGVKIGLIRVQAARIAKKTVKESTRDKKGDLRYDGEVKRRKGDVYMCDTTVTGSDSGTSERPKFSLLACFMETIFPKVLRMVAEDGEYPGFSVVIQGDNAGPHQDSVFKTTVKTYCESKGWYWEPQAPQMPYSNNLDLAVFPSMSKRHTRILSAYSRSVAKSDNIYQAVKQVWDKLPSSVIAQGYVLAYRICKKVIATKGDNSFLSGGDFHLDVRKDFMDTDRGVSPSKKRKRSTSTK